MPTIILDQLSQVCSITRGDLCFDFACCAMLIHIFCPQCFLSRFRDEGVCCSGRRTHQRSTHLHLKPHTTYSSSVVIPRQIDIQPAIKKERHSLLSKGERSSGRIRLITIVNCLSSRATGRERL